MGSFRAFRNQFTHISFYMLDGENKIIRNATLGEASAFGLLYDHYQPRIYRFVLIKVGRREDAEDLTHQVFLQAWQNVSGYKDLGFPFSSWLYQIARNLVIDFYRTNKRELTLQEIGDDALAGEPIAQLAVEKNFEIGRVQNAIQKLKPDHQDVIIMRFVEDLSIKEVAAALHKSEGSIKLMQHRAIKILKGFLS